MRRLSLSPAVQPIALFLLLVPLMLFIYAPSFDGGFYLDSKPYILQSHYFQGGINLSEAMERVFERGYHPASRRIIPNITMAFQTYSNGPIASRLRAFNVIVHTANISLLYIFLSLLTGLLLPNARRSVITRCSMAAALMWGFNPFQVETVAYIVQRSVLMVTFFYLLGAIIFLIIVRDFKPGKLSLLWLPLALSLSAAALSKENSVQFTATCLLLYLYLVPIHPDAKARKEIIWPLLGTGLLIVVIMFTARGLESSPLSAYSILPFNPTERLLTESRVVLDQLSLFIFPWPGRLSLTPYYDLSRSLFMPLTTLLSLVFIVATVAGIFLSRKKPILLGAALIWFFSNHLIESTIIPLEIAFPHRTYLPSALIFLIPLVAAGSAISQKKSDSKYLTYLGTGAIFVTVALMAFGTYQHNRTWGNEREFWLHNINVSPGSTIPYISLSGYLLENRRSESSLRVIEKGLLSGDFDNDRRDRKGNLLVNKGIALSNLGQLTDGIYWVKEALKLQPSNIQYQYNLAALMMQSYRWDEAGKILENIIQSDSTYPDANMQLALIYENRGLYKKALTLIQRELSLFPENKTAQSISRRILLKSEINKQ